MSIFFCAPCQKQKEEDNTIEVFTTISKYQLDIHTDETHNYPYECTTCQAIAFDSEENLATHHQPLCRLMVELGELMAEEAVEVREEVAEVKEEVVQVKEEAVEVREEEHIEAKEEVVQVKEEAVVVELVKEIKKVEEIKTEEGATGREQAILAEEANLAKGANLEDGAWFIETCIDDMRSQMPGERPANMGNKEEPSVPTEDVARRLEEVVKRLESVLEKATGAATGAIPKVRRGGPRDKNGRQ